MNKEDITYEYEKYFLNLMKESKTNLYIRAGEINCKRVFFQRLKEKGETLKNRTFLGIASDAADRFYLFFLENYEEKMQRLYDMAADEWIQETFYSGAGSVGKS